MAGTAVDADLTLSDFDYSLPPELIAQQPLPARSASRLLHVAPDRLSDLVFTDIERLLTPGDVLVFNDTRVIRARLLGRKPSGGRVEVLVERIVAPTRALALVRTSHTPRVGQVFVFGEDGAHATATVRGRQDDFFELEFEREVLATLDAHGNVPLPPYIAHADTALDAERYQTVYAAKPGAVAAPTAGLHFTETLLARLRERGVRTAALTLHVGAGTFQPVRVERIRDHTMHSEWYELPPATADAVAATRAGGGRVVAVGTTSLRALESAAREDGSVAAGSRDTALFITPGYRFRAVDRLITNFHLPRSTLLMLASAFAGIERIRSAYAHAVAQRYRFFSYGDAMLLERAP
ncbi:MAG: tRNA preQ1(34) S-adenosylmethionine ribosyltransferase-isomerase QueA [Burkholderiales bacterium]|jgi:S-adenosylmethionine:tRNA ribosyltransferase-isomerase|nr:tRNA preQ1(34) S-adenosylmethionine ribosyltransferase-isomerase QueA [Burkholderiales bacterium]